MTTSKHLVVVPDFFLRGAGFAAQWQECSVERDCYAYTIPFVDDPWYPQVVCWFSHTRFDERELQQLCAGDDAPLQAREQAGEPRCGFQWPLTEVQLRPRTALGRWIQQQTLLQ